MRLRFVRHAFLLAAASAFLFAGHTGTAVADQPAESPLGATASTLATVQHGLLRFETAVQWKDVDPKWRRLRGKWIRAVRAADTPNKVAQLTLALESHMGWPSVQPRWRKIRPGWVRASQRAATPAAAARLLLQLEANTKWSAVYKSWAKQRKPWVRRLQGVR